jgi:hypothetical protein
MPPKTTLALRLWTWFLAALGLASVPMAAPAQPLATSNLSATKSAVSFNQSAAFVERAPHDAVLPALMQGSGPNK